ncbi:serine hydrolase domain-containing protein [Allorhizocola rhizosphaerae]|uniref:serine hydrolase domain-containing protein n=1 Tax=Allorhizocola rhizosphaerae TaxID=1872709 RepID=UPI000E3D717D|nr:serine hydrolase domain-containing protein [Allorhizocola rhizosphaerae]
MLLPQTARRVDDLLAETQADGRAPTVAGAVIRDGAMVHFGAFGADPATGEIPTRDTQFRIGSITKTLTAVLLLQLRDEGKLALDDLLYRHLPGTPVGSAITLRQLLGHVSGLQREPDGQWWERSEGTDLETFLSALTPDKIAYPPHRSYHYSNLAYGLLGAVVQRLSSGEWIDVAHKRLFEPLNMVRTSHTEVEPFARGYVVHPWYGTLREEPRTDTRAMAPAGQLWSTAADMAKWAAFLADPDPAVLSADTMAEMCAPVVISDLDAWTAGHGLGIELYRRGERVFAGHGGSMPGYLAHLLVHRPSRTGTVVFAGAYTLQGRRIAEVNQRLLTMVLDAEPPRTKPWTPPAIVDTDLRHELAGVWWWMGRRLLVTADPVGGTLTAAPEGIKPWLFVSEGNDVWRCLSGMNDGELMRVRRDADGRPSELDIATFVHTREP